MSLDNPRPTVEPVLDPPLGDGPELPVSAEGARDQLERWTGRLAAAPKRGGPKLLLAACLPYLLSARLTVALQDCGFEVEVICAARHPVGRLKKPPLQHPLGFLGASSVGRWGAQARFAAAIARAQPDGIVPCDDQAATILRRMRRTLRNLQIAKVIDKSIGPAVNDDLLDSRSAQVALARKLGVRTPHSAPVDSEAMVRHALAGMTYPLFLKGDGSWGGLGVTEVYDEAEALQAWRRLSHAHTLSTAILRVRSHGWRFALSCMRNARPKIDVQSAVVGHPANHAVVCRDGQVLAALSVMAVETTSSVGPASVVRVIENDEMRESAAALVAHLKLSGFVGFDFILGADREAYFLEINSRATPITPLAIAGCADLPAALFAALSEKQARPRARIDNDFIALFPDEIGRDAASAWLSKAHHDIPLAEPGLIAFGLESLGGTHGVRPPSSRRSPAEVRAG